VYGRIDYNQKDKIQPLKKVFDEIDSDLALLHIDDVYVTTKYTIELGCKTQQLIIVCSIIMYSSCPNCVLWELA